MSFGKRIFISLPLLVGSLVSESFAAMEFKEADITTVKNIVERNEGSGAVPAKVSDKLRENSKVSTAAASMAELTFADSSITRMGSNTQFSFQSKERLVKLDQGTLLIHTPPGNGGATVDCGGVTAAVTGTTFMASRDGVGNVLFVLLEGQGGLKVTVGGASALIRPGQAASVGAETVKESAKAALPEKTSSIPGAGSAGDEQASAGKGGSGTGPDSTTPAGAPKIQVFDVDVKKIATTSPLMTSFQGELPSAGKIDAVIDSQQQAVQEGKLEKLEVEAVAVKSADGDLLVGAPKVEKEEFAVINKQMDVAGRSQGGGDDLDVDTAAGPGAGPGGGMAAAPRPGGTAPTAPRIILPPVNPGQVVGGTQPPPSPSRLDFGFGLGTATVTLDRPVNAAQTINFTGINFPGLAVASGSSSASFSFDPKDYFLGFDPNRNLVLTRLVTASMGSLSESALFGHSQLAIQGANPVRRMLGVTTMGADELAALDAFFYFRSAASGTPANFYQAFRTRTVDLGAALPAGIRSLAGSVDLGKDYLFAGQIVSQPSSAVNLASPETVFYADQIRLGPANPTPSTSPSWVTLVDSANPWNVPDGNPAGSFEQLNAVVNSAGLPLAARFHLEISPADPFGAYLGDFAAYLRHTTPDGESRTVHLFDRIGATALDPSGSPANGLNVTLSDWASANINLQDTAGTLTGALTGTYRPYYGGWPVSLNDLVSIDPSGNWTLFVADLSSGAVGQVRNWSLEFASIFQPQHTLQLAVPTVAGAERRVTFASGDDGTSVFSTRFLADGAEVEFVSSGAVEMQQAQFEDLGSKFTVEATGQVSLGAAPTAGAQAVDEHQVRILADTVTDGSGNQVPTPGSLALIRSGDSLELRNVTIRGFAETRLESVAGGVTTGRVLMSGSSVRDFRIRDLVGAAVNTDAKIQMAALDAQGGLAGELVVDKGLPVATRLAGEIDSTLTGPLAQKAVHAQQVDLAARSVKFQDATVTAMSAITARANTVILQNSFLTVVQSTGMINMYVQSGLVNQSFGTVVDGRVNFAGLNQFSIGNTTFAIGNQTQLNSAYGNTLLDLTQNGGVPQAGKVNVLKL